MDGPCSGTLKDAKFEMKEIHFPESDGGINGRFFGISIIFILLLYRKLTICARQKNPVALDRNRYMGEWIWVCGFDGSLLGLPRAYRDPYTDGAPEDFFQTDSQRKRSIRTGIRDAV